MDWTTELEYWTGILESLSIPFLSLLPPFPPSVGRAMNFTNYNYFLHLDHLELYIKVHLNTCPSYQQQQKLGVA